MVPAGARVKGALIDLAIASGASTGCPANWRNRVIGQDRMTVHVLMGWHEMSQRNGQGASCKRFYWGIL